MEEIIHNGEWRFDSTNSSHFPLQACETTSNAEAQGRAVSSHAQCI